MRNLRWAAELAVSDDATKALLGVLELEALQDSRMLSKSELVFVEAALKLTIEGPRQAIARLGEAVEVVRSDADVAGGIPVSSEDGDHGEEANTE